MGCSRLALAVLRLHLGKTLMKHPVSSDLGLDAVEHGSQECGARAAAGGTDLGSSMLRGRSEVQETAWMLG